MTNETLVPQDSADHWTGRPGIYRFVALSANQVSTMGVTAQGGVDWDSVVTAKSGQIIVPCNQGWPMGVGDYKVVIPLGEGKQIVTFMSIVEVPFNGLTARMVPIDSKGNPFPKTDDGYYLIPVYVPFSLMTIWTDGKGNVASDPGYYVGGSFVEYNGINWLSNTGGKMEGTVVGDNWAIVNASAQGTDMGPTTVIGLVYVRFTPETNIGPGKG
jgi:hypothetical protein